MQGYAVYVDPPSQSFADDSAAETASGRGTTTSSRRRWGFRSFFSTANEDVSLDSIDDEDDDDNFEMMQTNGLSDRNTIVDMSLRMDRFVLLVALALAAAFSFAYFTNSAVKLATVAASDEQDVTDTVELYNTIFGFILFAGGKVFEVYSETLIFPTLTTYLHNCSLYPGDQPARVHSPIKVRAIFWGLKTVIILMNVAFASVFVGQRTITSTSTRRLSAADFGDALRVSSPLQDFQVSELLGGSPGLTEDSIFRSSMFGFRNEFDVVEAACDDRWVDAPTVAFGFPVHDWNAELYLRSEPVMKVEIPHIGEYLAQRDAAEDGDDAQELAPEITAQGLLEVFEQGYRAVKRSLAINGLTMPTNADENASGKQRSVQTVRELVQAMAQMLKESNIIDADLDGARVRLEKRELSEDFAYVSVTMEIPRRASLHDGSIECGRSGCVYSDQTKSSWSSGAFAVPFSSNGDVMDDSAMLAVGVDRVFEATSSTEVNEKIIVSIGKLSWRLERLDERHHTQCESDVDADGCVGVSISMLSGRGEVLVGKRALATDHGRASLGSPLQLVKIGPATVWTPQGDYSTWYSLKSGLSHVGIADSANAFTVSELECVSTVDSYRQYAAMEFSTLEDKVYTAALFYLLQDGVAVHYRDPVSRRLALAVSEAAQASSSGSSDSDGMKDIEIAVPTLSAFVTITGCVAMLVLMVCVVFLPTPRVKLSPNTTPAAQYVQILTDDLYPDIVHKKRLRFANGDCLLFNEYIVDSIVLHAERNHKKKIYL